MRLRRMPAQFGPPDLHQHDRLAVAPREVERGGEARALADAFRIGADHLDFRRLRHPTDRLAERDIGLVARGDADRRADAARAGDSEDMRPVGAGLGRDADIPRQRPALFEGQREHRVEVHRRVEQAEAVRPQQAHPVLARGRHHAVLRGLAGLVHFREARGENDRRAAALGAEVVHRLHRGFARHGDDGDIRHLRQRRDIREGRQPLHRRPVRVHRQDGALVALALHVGDGPPADARRIVGGTDNGDGTRPHHGVEGSKTLRGHGLSGLASVHRHGHSSV